MARWPETGSRIARDGTTLRPCACPCCPGYLAPVSLQATWTMWPCANSTMPAALSDVNSPGTSASVRFASPATTSRSRAANPFGRKTTVVASQPQAGRWMRAACCIQRVPSLPGGYQPSVHRTRSALHVAASSGRNMAQLPRLHERRCLRGQGLVRTARPGRPPSSSLRGQTRLPDDRVPSPVAVRSAIRRDRSTRGR